MHERIQLTEEELNRRRRKSVALALVLAALVLVILAVTYVKGTGLLDKPI